jgi:hypothetical protein
VIVEQSAETDSAHALTREQRHLHHNKICVAIARELAGFIWDIGRHVSIHDISKKAPKLGGANTKGHRPIAAPVPL